MNPFAQLTGEHHVPDTPKTAMHAEDIGSGMGSREHALRAIHALLKGPRTAGDVARELGYQEDNLRVFYKLGVDIGLLKEAGHVPRSQVNYRFGRLPTLFALNLE